MSVVVLRPAAPADVDLIYRWANDPETRANSFFTEPIAYESHVAWYEASLERKNRHLLVAERDERPVALVRFDDDADGAALVGINVAPEQRGRGVGRHALLAGAREAWKLGYRKIVALIRPDNAGSIKAFERAGYQAAGEQLVEGTRALRYELVP